MQYFGWLGQSWLVYERSDFPACYSSLKNPKTGKAITSLLDIYACFDKGALYFGKFPRYKSSNPGMLVVYKKHGQFLVEYPSRFLSGFRPTINTLPSPDTQPWFKRRISSRLFEYSCTSCGTVLRQRYSAYYQRQNPRHLCLECRVLPSESKSEIEQALGDHFICWGRTSDIPDLF